MITLSLLRIGLDMPSECTKHIKAGRTEPSGQSILSGRDLKALQDEDVEFFLIPKKFSTFFFGGNKRKYGYSELMDIRRKYAISKF